MAADQVQEILIALADIRSKLDTALTVQADHEERLRAVEGKSGKRWEALTTQIISLAAAGFLGWLLGQIQ